MTARGNSDIESICMLSTHGYFDPVPQLGRTDTGGQVLYVLQLCKAFSRQGIKVDIYTRWFDRSQEQVDPVPGYPDVRVVRIPAGLWEFIPKERIYDVLPELARNMVGFIRENGLRYDLFHAHYVDAGIVMMDVAGEFDKPAFLTAHSLGALKRQRTAGDPEEMERVFNFSHRIAEELRLFKSVHAQTLTSNEEIEQIEELYGFRPPRAEFIPPGVDVHQFVPLAEGEREIETEIPLPEKYIFVVSRISRIKGHDLLMPAFLRVAQEVPDVYLVIAGGSKTPDAEETEVMLGVKHFVEANGLSGRVHIVGGIPHDDLPPYYRQAQLFILPPRYEPFGMTALEAMACRTPAVISKFSGVQEAFTSGVDCLVVDPFQSEEYARAIISLLRDRTLAAKLAQAGREVVLREFSWEAIAEKHLAFYRKYMAT
ncbi:MAG TPA: glycosyltransferase family 1 protein [Dehalococcoidia bacterium]|nr:glycosyltransferase family 1 protein [Dehalococcoidia bacterium]